MKKISVTVTSGSIHARPAALIKKAAQECGSNVKISTAEKDADAESVIELMALGAGEGAVLSITADGGDEDEALRKISEIISGGE